MAAIFSESLGGYAMTASAARRLGTIITFYSYKGGTGRTMALANTACVLAERIEPNEKVLVVDWDLEAPGLHQFLPPRLRSRDPSLDTGLGADPGLIDLFVSIRDALPPTVPASEEEAAAVADAVLAQIRIEHFISDTEVPNIHIMRAGRNDDGTYSKRVNTFDWEGLFRCVPGIYRKVADCLAERYRYVLVDSRTGVTDISGICTSLLPEKLVVVFTPNRQSLTGVRELIGRTTSYRLGSDDLRPLLVYPLPSRIEVSLEKLNSHWRYGNVDAGIAGYQPMFQNLLKECYALKDCDLTEYFNDVQIQQSADCAYGEVISVRQNSGERLSLASSYRVFVDRLLAAVPPWNEYADGVVASTAPVGISSQPRVLPTALGPKKPTASAPTAVTARASAESKVPRTSVLAVRNGKKVFLSYAREDRSQVSEVAGELTRLGYEVWFDRDIGPGVDFQAAIATALDASDVVMVFWSRASVASNFVKLEASEGSRRGVLVPVLLDDSHPPLEFRRYQSADLSRPSEAGLARLLDDVAHVARRMRAEAASVQASGSPPLAASRRLSSSALWPVLGISGLVAMAVLFVWVRPGDTVRTAPASGAVSAAASAPMSIGRVLDVPDFKGRATDDVQKVAEVVGLSLVMTDESNSVEQTYLEGVVIGQFPAAGSRVEPKSIIRLTVATRTTNVPSVVGVPLVTALTILQKGGLALGKTETIVATGAQAGWVVRQSPQAGTLVPAGTKVEIGVAAAEPPTSTPSPKVIPPQTRRIPL
jgi:Mrp family chromosome partitioning ATPase